MIQTKDIGEILKKYKDNMDRQQELDKQLLTDQSRDEWIACLQNRAVEIQKMYIENGQLIQDIDFLLEQPLTETFVNQLYTETYDMYWDGYDDCQILLPLIYKLIGYYEKNPEIDRLLFLYGAAYYEENEIQNRRDGSHKMSVDYLLKIIAYQPEYLNIPTADGRRRFWGAYYNIIVVALGNRAIDIDQSYQYLKTAMNFWNSPEVQALDGDNEEISNIVSRIANEWLAAEEYIEQSSPETKEVFCKLACEAYEREMQENDSLKDINSEVYAAYLHAQVILGKQDFDSIIDAYFAYYNSKIKNNPDAPEMTDEDFYFVLNTPLTLERWLDYGTSEEKRQTIISTLKNFTQETWYEKLTKYSSPFINEIMSQWCFKLMKYLNTQDEKDECLFQLLVRRQLPTYLHSVMVMHLAEALCKEVRRSRSELLAPLEEPIRDNIVNYVKQCALLHDVGKTQITDIVNTQGRRLWDSEFQGIRQHPVYGAEMINKDSDFAKYHDIALGHHKSYDGKTGYPASFDNTASPYRIIIDLITICDCIDAATDHLGRNYKTAKTLDMVLEELIAGKNTRYNPDLVEVIENSPRLRKEMRYIVSEGRLDIMYRAYLESVL